MASLSFAELEDRAEALDAAAAATPMADVFCSSSAWTLSAREAFLPDAEPLLLETDGGFATLMAAPFEGGGRVILPLEGHWGLACPFVGPRPERVVAAFADALAGDRRPLALSGLHEHSPATRAFLVRFASSHRLGLGARTLRIVGDLRRGVDGWLASRSPKFRANLLRTRRLAERRGWSSELIVDFSTPGVLEAAFERVLAIEARSWKAPAGGGILEEPMVGFYRTMTRRLAARGALRLLVARRQGVDAAYAFGGVGPAGFRGLQASYDDAFARESPGLLVHLELITRLAAAGVTAYDLGSDMPYKRRWGEVGLETLTLIALPRRA